MGDGCVEKWTGNSYGGFFTRAQQKEKRQYRQYRGTLSGKDSGGKKPASAPQCDDSGGGTEKGSAQYGRKDHMREEDLLINRFKALWKNRDISLSHAGP